MTPLQVGPPLASTNHCPMAQRSKATSGLDGASTTNVASFKTSFCAFVTCNPHGISSLSAVDCAGIGVGPRQTPPGIATRWPPGISACIGVCAKIARSSRGHCLRWPLLHGPALRARCPRALALCRPRTSTPACLPTRSASAACGTTSFLDRWDTPWDWWTIRRACRRS